MEPPRLNPKYTFETFVIGASNRFAHAAAVAVAEAPAKAYNPLFVYGESGLGKTHLLHAIGHYGVHLFPGARVRYVSSEEFTNDFINSLRDDKAQAFQRRYRDVDILLVDDIQFLENKERTQEEFFHTFNTLHNASKQIVISSDRPPKQLSTLEDRLRTRFEWGLITDVQPPDLETRIAILRKKAAQDRLAAPPDVLEFIASKIATNIRELEGALIRVTAFASLNRQPVDLALAEIVLKDLIPTDGGPEITGATIMAATAEYFGLTWRTCAARPARGCWSPAGRSRCTCAGSSPTCRCPRSARCSAAATTPPSSTPTARSAGRWPSVGRPTTRSPSSPTASRPGRGHDRGAAPGCAAASVRLASAQPGDNAVDAGGSPGTARWTTGRTAGVVHRRPRGHGVGVHRAPTGRRPR